MSQLDRAEILLALEPVDVVLVFGEDTPVRLIKEVKPQVLVKGPGNTRPLPGENEVWGWGGHVAVPDWPVNHSTTAILERVESQ